MGRATEWSWRCFSPFDTVLQNEVPIETLIAPSPGTPALRDDRPINEYYLLRRRDPALAEDAAVMGAEWFHWNARQGWSVRKNQCRPCGTGVLFPLCTRHFRVGLSHVAALWLEFFQSEVNDSCTAARNCSAAQLIWSWVMMAGGARSRWSPEMPSTLPCMG